MGRGFLPCKLLIFWMLYLLSVVADAENDSCNSKLSNVKVEFDMSSSTCASVWDSENFILRFKESSPGKWYFVLSAPDRGTYISLGFSSDGKMVKASSIVGWIPSTGKGQVKQYYLGGYESSNVLVDRGDLKFTSSSVERLSSRLYLSFLLTNSTPANTGAIIYAAGPDSFVPAASAFSLRVHRQAHSASLNLSSGAVENRDNTQKKLRTTHGLLNTLGWGFLMIIGAIVARHLKNWDPMWFYLHMAIQLLAVGLGIAGVVTGFMLEDRQGAHVKTHKSIAITILALGGLQLTAILIRPDKTSKIRKYWNWFHHFSGRFAIIFAIANVFYGFHLADHTNGLIAYGVVVAILFVLAVMLEIRMFMKK